MSKSRNKKKREWAEEHQDSLPGPSSLNSKERRHIKRKLAAAGRDLEADYEPPDAVIYEDEEEEYEPPDAIVEEPVRALLIPQGLWLMLYILFRKVFIETSGPLVQ